MPRYNHCLDHDRTRKRWALEVCVLHYCSLQKMITVQFELAPRTKARSPTSSQLLLQKIFSKQLRCNQSGIQFAATPGDIAKPDYNNRCEVANLKFAGGTPKQDRSNLALLAGDDRYTLTNDIVIVLSVEHIRWILQLGQ